MGEREFSLWIEDITYLIQRIRVDNAFRELEDNEME